MHEIRNMMDDNVSDEHIKDERMAHREKVMGLFNFAVDGSLKPFQPELLLNRNIIKHNRELAAHSSLLNHQTKIEQTLKYA